MTGTSGRKISRRDDSREPRATDGHDERDQRHRQQRTPGNVDLPRIAGHGADHAEQSAELARAEQRGRCNVWVYGEQGRNLDQPATADHRVDESCGERRGQH